jgi:5-methylthioadenosine/S-adenosylhomocysteine deaminase
MRAVVAPKMADRTLYQAMPGLLDSMPTRLRTRYEALATAPFHISIDVCRRAFHQWAFDRTRIRPALAPTIPLHCSDDFLEACGALAHEFDLPLQTHLAETKTQAMLGYRKYGKSLTAHLDDLGLLTGRFGAAHAIWIDDDDMMRLADKGARVAHNPLSNLRLGSGVAPVRRMLDRGLPVGIGTDGSNTSDGQNMFEALRLAAYLSRLQGANYETWLSAREALRLATLGSAELLGFDRIGRIAPGYEADLVFLRLDSPHLVPLRAPLLQTVFAETGASVQTVMIGGRTVFDNGHLLTTDEAKLRCQAEDAAARLDGANTSTAHSAADIAEVVGAFCVAHGRAHHHVHRRLPDHQTS